MTVGERIRVLRETVGISQQALGSRLNMTQRKISYLENDKYEPSIDDIREICLCFGVSADYLLGLPEHLAHPKR